MAAPEAIGAKPPEAEVLDTGPIERVLPEELYPRVGTALEKIKLLGDIIPQETLDAAAGVLRRTNTRKFVISRKIKSDPPEVIKVKFVKPEGGETLKISLEGDIERKPEIPDGLPLKGSFTGKLYRKVNPQAEKPMAKVGTVLAPGQGLARAMKGKRVKWNYPLPRDKFPKGGKVTWIFDETPEGIDIKPDTIFAYVEPIK